MFKKNVDLFRNFLYITQIEHGVTINVNEGDNTRVLSSNSLKKYIKNTQKNEGVHHLAAPKRVPANSHPRGRVRPAAGRQAR